MHLIIFAIMLVSFSAIADEDSLYAQNDAGGYTTLTKTACPNKEISEKFPYYTYATTQDGTKFEGCWALPNTEGIPANAIPVVNIWFEGQVIPRLISDFGIKKIPYYNGTI